MFMLRSVKQVEHFGRDEPGAVMGADGLPMQPGARARPVLARALAIAACLCAPSVAAAEETGTYRDLLVKYRCPVATAPVSCRRGLTPIASMKVSRLPPSPRRREKEIWTATASGLIERSGEWVA